MAKKESTHQVSDFGMWMVEISPENDYGKYDEVINGVNLHFAKQNLEKG